MFSLWSFDGSLLFPDLALEQKQVPRGTLLSCPVVVVVAFVTRLLWLMLVLLVFMFKLLLLLLLLN